jgi:hypothetical protein
MDSSYHCAPMQRMSKTCLWATWGAIDIIVEDQSHDIEYNMLLLRIMYVLAAVNAPCKNLSATLGTP